MGVSSPLLKYVPLLRELFGAYKKCCSYQICFSLLILHGTGQLTTSWLPTPFWNASCKLSVWLSDHLEILWGSFWNNASKLCRGLPIDYCQYGLEHTDEQHTNKGQLEHSRLICSAKYYWCIRYSNSLHSTCNATKRRSIPPRRPVEARGAVALDGPWAYHEAGVCWRPECWRRRPWLTWRCWWRCGEGWWWKSLRIDCGKLARVVVSGKYLYLSAGPRPDLADHG